MTCKSISRFIKILEEVNKLILKDNVKTWAYYEVEDCSETVFNREGMVKNVGLQKLLKRMKAIKTSQRDIYKFLGIEEADGVNAKNSIQWSGGKRLQDE